MHAPIIAFLLLAVLHPGIVASGFPEPPDPVTLTTAPATSRPSGIEVLGKTGRDLIRTSTASPRMRAAAMGWLDSIEAGPGFPSRFERLASTDRIAAYLDARFEGELLRGGMIEPLVLEAMQAVPPRLERGDELRWALAGLLDRPPPDPTPVSRLDCTFRLGPARPAIIDLIATSTRCPDLAAIFDAASPADRPMIGAAVLATGRCPDLEERILDFGNPEPPATSAAAEAYRTALLVELADRDADEPILTLIDRHPTVLTRTGIRAVAATGLARAGRIDEVLELLGGSEQLDRFPAASSGEIRAAMAHSAFLAGDRDRARWIGARIGRGDSRMLAGLVLDDPALADPLDPAPPLESLRNLRIVRPMQWVAMIERDPMIRERAVRILAALLAEDRTPLALGLLAPNGFTTRTGGDGWYEDRIGMLSDAMALAKRPMDDWAPLLEAVTRLKSPASQVEALVAIARGVERAHPGEPLTTGLRDTLDRALIEITIGG